MFDRTIVDLYGLDRAPKGFHVGIEVEMEFDPRHPVPVIPRDDSVWSFHADGSLLNGLEAVTRPIFPDSKQWSSAYAQLKELFRTSPLVEDSERTSTHVHLNVSDRTLRETFTVGTAFWAMENILFSFCAEYRRSNHFCIGVSDTIVTIEELVRQIKQGNLPRITEERGKYSALNWARIGNIGTLECRIREGLTDADLVFDWARLVSDIGANTLSNWRDPSSLITDLSQSPEETSFKILGKRAYQLALHTHGAKLPFVASSNVLPLVPLMSVDWGKDYSRQVPKKKAVAIPVGPVEDDPIFEDDEVVEFNEGLFQPDQEAEEVPEVQLRVAQPVRPFLEEQALNRLVQEFVAVVPEAERPAVLMWERAAPVDRRRERAPRLQGAEADNVWLDDPFIPR